MRAAGAKDNGERVAHHDLRDRRRSALLVGLGLVASQLFRLKDWLNRQPTAGRRPGEPGSTRAGFRCTEPQWPQWEFSAAGRPAN